MCGTLSPRGAPVVSGAVKSLCEAEGHRRRRDGNMELLRDVSVSWRRGRQRPLEGELRWWWGHIMTSHKIFNVPTPWLSEQDTELLIHWWSVQDAAQLGQQGRGVTIKTTTKTHPDNVSLLPCVKHAKWLNERGSSGTPVLVEAITFECQKIILGVIFSNISGTAKGMNGHRGKEMTCCFCLWQFIIPFPISSSLKV